MRKAGRPPGAKNKAKKFNAHYLLSQLTASLGPSTFAQDRAGNLFQYSAGAYRELADESGFPIPQVQWFLVRAKKWFTAHGASAHWRDEYVSWLINDMRAQALSLWPEPPHDRINVRNGILDLRGILDGTMIAPTLLAHGPHWLSRVQLPIDYDPSATCPAWDLLKKTSLPEDAPEILEEICAWLMTPINPGEKALVLLGAGGEGKSVIQTAIKAFIGDANITHTSLAQLSENRFSLVRLEGKLVCSAGDLRGSIIENDEIFKMIVGHDALQAEVKYGAQYDFKPFCKLIFNANSMPQSSAGGHSWYRRWLTLPIAARWHVDGAPKEAFHSVVARLRAPSELSGLLNRALSHLHRVAQVGPRESAAMEAMLREEQAATDPTRRWIRQSLEPTEGGQLAKSDIYDAYAASLATKGVTPVLKAIFFRTLYEEIPEATSMRKNGNGGEDSRYLRNIAFRSR